MPGTQGLRPLFASGTDGKVTRGLVIQDDGNCVIYDANHKPVWSSNHWFKEEVLKRTKFEVSSDTLSKMGSSPILVARCENAADSISFWDERINH